MRKLTLAELPALIVARSRRNPATGCLEWQGKVNSHGYGHTAVGRVSYKNHRVIYAAVHGEIPSTVHVLHRCDNRRCVEIAHLYAGSNARNIRDKLERDRSGKKLSICKAAAIKARLARGERQSDIARDFGVHQGLISRIGTGRIWNHVGGAS